MEMVEGRRHGLMNFRTVMGCIRVGGTDSGNGGDERGPDRGGVEKVM